MFEVNKEGLKGQQCSCNHVDLHNSKNVSLHAQELASTQALDWLVGCSNTIYQGVGSAGGLGQNHANLM